VVLFPAEARYFSLLQRFQTGPVSHRASYSVIAVGKFCEAMIVAIPPLLICLNGVHRDIFCLYV
jgi:hypothetical protein